MRRICRAMIVEAIATYMSLLSLPAHGTLPELHLICSGRTVSIYNNDGKFDVLIQGQIAEHKSSGVPKRFQDFYLQYYRRETDEAFYLKHVTVGTRNPAYFTVGQSVHKCRVARNS